MYECTLNYKNDQTDVRLYYILDTIMYRQVVVHRETNTLLHNILHNVSEHMLLPLHSKKTLHAKRPLQVYLLYCHLLFSTKNQSESTFLIFVIKVLIE